MDSYLGAVFFERLALLKCFVQSRRVASDFPKASNVKKFSAPACCWQFGIGPKPNPDEPQTLNHQPQALNPQNCELD